MNATVIRKLQLTGETKFKPDNNYIGVQKLTKYFLFGESKAAGMFGGFEPTSSSEIIYFMSITPSKMVSEDSNKNTENNYSNKIRHQSSL